MIRCPRCSRAGDSQEDLQGTCIDKQVIDCPPPLPVLPGRDVVLVCRDAMCGKVFSFRADAILSKTVPPEVSCPRAICAIQVAAPTVTTTEKPRPAPPFRGKA